MGDEIVSSVDRMQRFRITEGMSKLANFAVVLPNVSLDRPEYQRPELAAYAAKSGVYCLVMRQGPSCYMIYVGRTNSWLRRLKEYCNDFQPGTPNDYKVRHFQRWTREIFPEAELDLYFVEAREPKALETDILRKVKLLRKVKPFINEPTHGDKKALLESNWAFYRESFEKRLWGGNAKDK
jgi:hypothetical protein